MTDPDQTKQRAPKRWIIDVSPEEMDTLRRGTDIFRNGELSEAKVGDMIVFECGMERQRRMISSIGFDLTLPENQE